MSRGTISTAVEPKSKKSPVAYQGERASGEVGSATAFTGESTVSCKQCAVSILNRFLKSPTPTRASR